MRIIIKLKKDGDLTHKKIDVFPDTQEEDLAFALNPFLMLHIFNNINRVWDLNN